MLALLALVAAAPLSSPAYTALVAFGDSYTDTGNFPSSPPGYWNGRFSNGPLWIEYLSQTLGFPYSAANNYAVSGTESDQLGVAIAGFPGTTDSADVLFAIWSGNNDFVNHLNLDVNDTAWNTRIDGIVSSLMTASDLVYQKGARNLVLFNLFDLTRCPGVLSAYSSSFRSYIAGKIQTFNSRLAAAVPNLLSTHPGLQVFLIDLHSDFNYLLENYTSLGFTSATVGALNDPNLADLSFSGPGANYVFWDSQHPTTKTHNLIAQWVASVLPAPPPPAVTITSPQNGVQFTAPASIPVAATVAANGWTVNQVTVLENGTPSNPLTNPPYDFTLSSLPTGTYTLSVQATYGAGQTVASAPVQVTVTTAPGSPPPAPWTSQDIGAVGQPGNAYYTPGGVFTVIGSGADIWGSTDAFHYVFQSFAGDGTVTALVSSLQNTDGFAKAGLMFRETLAPGARNAMIFITPGSGAGFQSRVASNANSSYTDGPSVAAPYWLKLERAGATLRGYVSPDSSQWALVGSVSISMSNNIFAGMAVTAHDNALLNTATFSNVQLAHSTSAIRPVVNISPLAVGTIRLTISGTIGSTYVCEGSVDLASWVPISTNLNTSGSIQIQQNVGAGIKFYRAYLAGQ